MSDEWKRAVEDYCRVYWVAVTESDPRKTIGDLIEISCAIALDPSISKEAAKLSGMSAQKREMADYLIRAFERGCDPEDYWRDIEEYRNTP